MSQTHEVINQVEPLTGANLWALNIAMQDGVRAHHPTGDAAALDTLGREAGSAAMQEHARLANHHSPQLLTHDSRGHRVDQVEFHPSYHALLGSALRHGLHGAPWVAGPGSHVQRAAAFMLFTELEPSVLCPVSMSYAVTPSLRANPALHAVFGPKLASTDYDGRFAPAASKRAVTMGMGMTEKQGGSDVRANSSRAVAEGSDAWGARFRITGHKWFMSAPMCDAFLVLAKTDAGNGQALSCFFVPRFMPDGSINRLTFQRLKHKLGNQANASSEVEFDGTAGWLVGEEGRGIPQILEMGALTRLDCALGTAGLMRQALTMALHHTRHRQAFGRTLADQPLMRNVLADLALESEAATLLALRLARAVDRTEHGQDSDGFEALMRRVLTPIAKFWICKRGSHFAEEAMECLGGNGYVEDQGRGTMARIYREMPLNSIWEGAGNIMALDLLRALRSQAGGAATTDALMHEAAAARAAHGTVRRLADRVAHDLARTGEEAQARRLARDVALLVQAAQLHAISPPEVFETFCEARIAQGSDAFGMLPASAPMHSLLQRAMPADTA